MTRDFPCLCLVKSVGGVVEVMAGDTGNSTVAGGEELQVLLLPIWAIAALSVAGLLVLLVGCVCCMVWQCCIRHKLGR